MIKILWKPMRDHFRRELLKQQNVRSGSSGKSGRMYCHFSELQFLKPVMQQRQESNFSMDTEEEELNQTQENEHINEPQAFDEEDEGNTTDRQYTGATNTKGNQ